MYEPTKNDVHTHFYIDKVGVFDTINTVIKFLTIIFFQWLFIIQGGLFLCHILMKL